MNKFLKAYSNPLRQQIVAALIEGQEMTVTQIIESVNRPQAIVSQQLNVLEASGVLTRRKESTKVYCSVKPGVESFVKGLNNLLSEYEAAA